MDIAYYLSELLEQLGEVNVPGLGSFTRVKVDGYYNNDEGRFYPPASKIEFSQHYVEDDELARYIGVKKRISLASSKYFTEKYLNGLREEIMSKAITLADIGLLYFENGEIRFKAAEALPDPTFFGYPKITLNKLGGEPVNTDTIPVAEPECEPEPEVAEEIEQQQAEEEHQEIVADTLPTLLEEQVTVYDGGQEAHGMEEEVLEAEEIAPIEDYEILDDDGGQEGHGIYEQHDYFRPDLVEKEIPVFEDDTNFIQHNLRPEEEEQHRSYKWLWVTLIILAVAGIAVIGWYYSQQIQESTIEKKTVPISPKDTTDSARSADSIKNLPVGDTSNKATTALPPQNAPASTIDSTKRRYEIIATEAKDIKEATIRIENYQSLGYTAHIVSDAPGRRLKISLGTYTDKAEAVINQKKIKKVKGTWLLTINPKK